jgi:hypothetical protein
MLNKRERNKIYEEIVGYDFDPAEFKFEDTGQKVSVTHDSGSTFEFSREEEPVNPTLAEFGINFGDRYQYEVKASVAEGINQSHSASSIDYVVTVSVSGWLREIKATVGVPDYWKEMQDSRGSIAIIQRGDFANTPFSPAEQKQIAAQLQEVKKQVQELYGLSNRQMTQVNEKLDAVIEDAGRLGRKDWIVIFIGTILPLVLSDVLTWGAAHHILALTLHGLLHLFTSGIEPPQIPPQPIA